MNANSQELLNSLAKYSQQLDCRREVLAELADIGSRMVETAKAGMIPTLEEMLDNRQETLKRLERVLHQTRDLESIIADAVKLTSHPDADVAKAAAELTQSADNMASIVENIFQTQKECENVLSDSLVSLKGERQSISASKKLSGAYRSASGENPRFLDSRR